MEARKDMEGCDSSKRSAQGILEIIRGRGMERSANLFRDTENGTIGE